MFKKLLLLLALISMGNLAGPAKADGMKKSNQDNIGFVGKYETDQQENQNNLPLIEQEQVRRRLPNTGDNNPLPYLILTSLFASSAVLGFIKLKQAKHQQISRSTS